jgi:hypothetical protein
MKNLLKLENRPCVEEMLAHSFVDAKLLKLYREGKGRLAKSENVYVDELSNLIELQADEGDEDLRPLTNEE